MSVNVYLKKEKVGSLEESNLFDFRLLCEQVGYHTDVLNNSLYVRPWLEGKRLVIDLWDRENATKDLRGVGDCASRLPLLKMMQSILSAYGLETYILPEPHSPSQMDRRSRMANKAGGDLYLLMQASSMFNKNRIHLWYGYSSFKRSKSLAACLYASLHALEEARVEKPSLLWNPWSFHPYHNVLKEINMPGVAIEYPYTEEDENDERNVRRFASAFCQGVLAYFQVPVLSPSIHQPEIWELVAKYVLKVPLGENNAASQGVKYFPYEEEPGENHSPSLPIPELEFFDQEAVSTLPPEEPEQNLLEKSERREMNTDLIPERFEEDESPETHIESFIDNEGTQSSAQEEKSCEECEAADESREPTLLSSQPEEDPGQSAADSSEDSLEESDPVLFPSQDIPQPKQHHSPPPSEKPKQNLPGINEHQQMETNPIPQRFEEYEPSERDFAEKSITHHEGTLSSKQEEKSGVESEAVDESRAPALIRSLSEEDTGHSAADSSEDSPEESDPVPFPSQEIPQPRQQQPDPSLSTKAKRPTKTDPADPWAKMASLPHWNHSSLMRPTQPNNNAQQGASQTGRSTPFPPNSNRAPRDAKGLSQSSFPANATEINPFARKNASSSTVDPFKQQRPDR